MEADSAKMDAYNAIIAHETLRVAVIDNVQRVDAMPSALRCVCPGTRGQYSGRQAGTSRWLDCRALLCAGSFAIPLGRRVVASLSFGRSRAPKHRPHPPPSPPPPNVAPARREAMLAAFCALDEEYAEACRKGAARDGGTFRDPLSPNTGRFAFGALAKRISDLHAEYCGAAAAGAAADEGL